MEMEMQGNTGMICIDYVPCSLDSHLWVHRLQGLVPWRMIQFFEHLLRDKEQIKISKIKTLLRQIKNKIILRVTINS